jgi:hypothetical protein
VLCTGKRLGGSLDLAGKPSDRIKHCAAGLGIVPGSHGDLLDRQLGTVQCPMKRAAEPAVIDDLAKAVEGLPA